MNRLFGTCLNFGYNTILAAAHDLLKLSQSRDEKQFCNPLSTGTLLICDTAGGLVGILCAPLIPISSHIKIVFVTLLTMAGFMVVAYSYSDIVTLTSVFFIAFGAGFGEAVIMNESLDHRKSVISAYTSGSGAAAILSSTAYLSATFFFTTRTSLQLMLVVPLIMSAAYFCVIQKASGQSDDPQPGTSVTQEAKSLPVREKALVLMHSLPATLVPLLLTSTFRSFMSQGLFELMDAKESGLSNDIQYRLHVTLCNSGMFLAQSTAQWLPVRILWLLPVIEIIITIAIVVQILATESIFVFSLFLSFTAGLNGGAVVTLVYCKIRNECLSQIQSFVMQAAILFNELGSAIAGSIAIPTHTYICSLISSSNPRGVSVILRNN